MNRLPLSVAVATGTCFLVACGGQAEPDAASNPLLRYVPADTPFLMANLEAVPAEVTDAYLLRMGPFLEQFQSALQGFRTELASGQAQINDPQAQACLLYTSDAADDSKRV